MSDLTTDAVFTRQEERHLRRNAALTALGIGLIGFPLMAVDKRISDKHFGASLTLRLATVGICLLSALTTYAACMGKSERHVVSLPILPVSVGIRGPAKTHVGHGLYQTTKPGIFVTLKY